MSDTTVQSRADLDAEGDRIGTEFGLGQRTGAWMTKQLSVRMARGGRWILLMIAWAGLVLSIGLTGFGRGISAVLASDLVVAVLAAMTLPPRWRIDRLYLYAGGVVLQAAREAEPAVLRWADLESMTLIIGSGDTGGYVSACVLHDQAGRTMTVGHAFRAGIKEIEATAERVLAPDIVPDLVGRYDAGEAVTLGRITVDQAGITWEATPPAEEPEWQIPWAQARSIDIRSYGQRIRVKRLKGGARQAAMDGRANGFAVRYLIEHAAQQAGIAVTADDPAWDGETVYRAEAADPDPAATPAIIASAPAGPAPVPALPGRPDERWPAKRRWRLVTAAIAVLAIEGIVIGYLFATRLQLVTAATGNITSVSDGTNSVVFSSGGQNLIFTDGDGDLMETGISGGRSTTFNRDGYPRESGAIVSPDGATVAAIGEGPRVDLWNATTHAAKGSLQPADGTQAVLEALAYSPDGATVAAADMYGFVYLWDTATGDQQTLGSPWQVVDHVQALAFSPDDRTIALGDSSGDITLWDSWSGNLLGTLTGPGEPRFGMVALPAGVISLSFGMHGSLLAAAYGNGDLYLWDTSDQSLAAKLSGHDPVTVTAINPAGTLVAGGTSHGETYLWDVAAHQQVAVLGNRGGESAVTALAFSPDGSHVAIGGKSEITVWTITAR